MDFNQVLMQIINGLNIGSIYSLIALGYTMVYGVAKLINFAHGDIIMVGAYICYLCMSFFNLEWYYAIIISIVICTILGITIEKVAYKPLRKASRITLLITAIGVSFLLQSGFQLMFSANPKVFIEFIELPPLQIGNITVASSYYITLLTTIILTIILTIFIQKTKVGRAIRAVSEDLQAAELMGINSNRTISIVFGIGSFLAAIAGLLYCSSYPIVSPYIGVLPGLKAFIAAVVGGIGSIPGAVLGAFLLGFIETFTKAYISSALSDAIVFTILIVMLVFRPNGILGKSSKEKV